jgi:large conductance mechanosensitive channel
MKNMKSFFSDFKKFISKGNIVDLAIAVVVGSAFSKIVTSLVNDLIMPLIGLATGGAHVSDLKWVIREAVYNSNGVLVSAENSIKYGSFMQTVIDFLIISFFIFLTFRIINASTKKLERVKNELIERIKKSDETQQKDAQEIEEVQKEAKVVLTNDEKQEILLTEIRDLLKENIKPKKQAAKQKTKN